VGIRPGVSMREISEDGDGSPGADGGRTAREVLDDHLRLRADGRLDEDLRLNYAEDVIMITPGGMHHGHDGAREAADLLYRAIKDADDYEYTSVRCDDRLALLEWSAKADDMQITDGVDSFLIEDGLIKGQTIRYTVTFRELSQAHSIG
jgi:hypothetical protein